MINGTSHLSAKELAGHLGGKWEGDYWKAHCPAHEDAEPSLSISEKSGKVLLHCHANCPQSAVIDALRNRGLWPERGKANGHAKQSRHIVDTYDYADETRTLLSQCVRYQPKAFVQRRPDGTGGWHWNMHGARKVPYRLPEVLEAIGSQHVVFIVEGEKDVDNLLPLNIVATCNAGGAGNWTAEHASCLKSSDAIIIPDNDNAGRQHVESVAASLQGIATRVRILTLPGLPHKGDVSDWLVAGGTAEQLWQLAERAPEWRQANATHERAEAWPDPVRLPQSLLRVAPFDYDMLPDKVRAWVEDICERMQCPPDFVGVSVMAALGSLIGRKVAVRPQRNDDWTVVANQWGLCIGRPGVMKSPAMEEALGPLKSLASTARAEFNLGNGSARCASGGPQGPHQERGKGGRQAP